MEELRAALRLSGRVFRLNEVNAVQDARSAGFDYDPQTQSKAYRRRSGDRRNRAST